MIKCKNPIPDSPVEWLREIADAYLDAQEAIPFSTLTGQEMTVADLYQLAPIVCLKFRGIKNTKKTLKQATDMALSNYVVNLDENDEAMADPYMAFALCYIVSHFGLELISDNCVERVMTYLDEMRNG